MHETSRTDLTTVHHNYDMGEMSSHQKESRYATQTNQCLHNTMQTRGAVSVNRCTIIKNAITFSTHTKHGTQRASYYIKRTKKILVNN